MILKFVLMTAIGFILVVIAEILRNKFKNVKWVIKLCICLYVIGFILMTIGGFFLKKNAYENDWWWLL